MQVQVSVGCTLKAARIGSTALLLQTPCWVDTPWPVAHLSDLDWKPAEQSPAFPVCCV